MSTAPSPCVTSSHQAQTEARMALAAVSDQAMPVLVPQPAMRVGLPKAPEELSTSAQLRPFGQYCGNGFQLQLITVQSNEPAASVS